MKLLSHNELIRFAEPDQQTVAEALRRFQKIIDAHSSPRGWLEYAVKEGFLNVVLVEHAGQPAFVIWFQVQPEGRLWGEAAQSVSQKAQFPVLMEALDQLARQNGCRTIEFRTLRRGLVQEAQRYGYSPTSLNMSKAVSYGNT